MNELYPLKFKPIIKDIIWGGSRLKDVLGKDTGGIQNAAESWEISCVEGNISVVSEGMLEGNELEELIEIYMGDLVGDSVYNKYGTRFPLLLKFIDARADLSVQVHPNDEMAKRRHNSRGKTEMWYVLDADKGSRLYSGFRGEVNKETYLDRLNNKKLAEILNHEEVKKGNAFFIPAGRVHAIGKGILLAEIQQTSDFTYRIYDWDRVDANGNGRELHTELALEAMDFSPVENALTEYKVKANTSSGIVECPYFSTNIIVADKEIVADYMGIDSFVIYMCTDGEFSLKYEGGETMVKKGETILLPATIKEFVIKPKPLAAILEIYMPPEK